LPAGNRPAVLGGTREGIVWSRRRGSRNAGLVASAISQ
jgi:hypothetical protein